MRGLNLGRTLTILKFLLIFPHSVKSLPPTPRTVGQLDLNPFWIFFPAQCPLIVLQLDALISERSVVASYNPKLIKYWHLMDLSCRWRFLATTETAEQFFWVLIKIVNFTVSNVFISWFHCISRYCVWHSARKIRHILNISMNLQSFNNYSWFQTFAVFWMLYAFFWVIPRRLYFICRRFGALCLFHFHRRIKWPCLRNVGVFIGKKGLARNGLSQ